jgi:ribosomal protein S18 acetylase RimI-like enzyme
VVVVRWLEPDVAEDLALAPAVAEVVNRAYAHAEVGLFATKIERTDIDDARTSISRRETAVALLEGALVGSVRARALDGGTGWFGALGVDPVVHGRGFGEALVRFVEDDAAAAGRGSMQLEVLESEPTHPHLSRLRDWYERRGYRETSRLPLAELYPEDAARLLVSAMDVVTMRKPL